MILANCRTINKNFLIIQYQTIIYKLTQNSNNNNIIQYYKKRKTIKYKKIN